MLSLARHLPARRRHETVLRLLSLQGNLPVGLYRSPFVGGRPPPSPVLPHPDLVLALIGARSPALHCRYYTASWLCCLDLLDSLLRSKLASCTALTAAVWARLVLVHIRSKWLREDTWSRRPERLSVVSSSTHFCASTSDRSPPATVCLGPAPACPDHTHSPSPPPHLLAPCYAVPSASGLSGVHRIQMTGISHITESVEQLQPASQHRQFFLSPARTNYLAPCLRGRR